MNYYNIKTESLAKALKEASLTKLPGRLDADGIVTKKAGKQKIWVKAIALVKKEDRTESYGLAERRGDGFVQVVQDFGTLSRIMGIVGVYPYMYLDADRFLNNYTDGTLPLKNLITAAMTADAKYAGKIEALLKSRELSDFSDLDDDAKFAAAVDAAIVLQEQQATYDVQNNAIEEPEEPVVQSEDELNPVESFESVTDAKKEAEKPVSDGGLKVKRIMILDREGKVASTTEIEEAKTAKRRGRPRKNA